MTWKNHTSLKVDTVRVCISCKTEYVEHAHHKRSESRLHCKECLSLITETCECGHKRFAHSNTFSKGHGCCLNTKCNCIKFTSNGVKQ